MEQDPPNRGAASLPPAPWLLRAMNISCRGMKYAHAQKQRPCPLLFNQASAKITQAEVGFLLPNFCFHNSLVNRSETIK